MKCENELWDARALESEGMGLEEKTCAIICVYNEEKSIANIVRRSISYIPNLIVVDNGSIDKTAEEAEKTGAIVIRHERNLGKGAALRTGFNYSLQKGFDYTITLDGDGQHLPEEIPRFVEHAEVENTAYII